MKFNSITLTLFLSIVFIYLSQFIKFLSDNYIYSLLGFLLILHVLAHLRNHSADKLITGFLFTVFLISFLVFNEVDQKTLALRTSGVLAFLFLNITLLVGPWTRIKISLMKYYKERRHLGVATLLLAWLHASLILKIYLNSSPKMIFQTAFTFFGFTALFIFFLLGMTSWNYIQANFSLKTWKIIHFITLLIYLAMVYIFYNITESLTTLEIILLILFVLYWIFVAPYSFIKLILKRVNGWKQLHVLIYLAYFALIFHVWNSPLKFQALWLKIVFIIIVATTLGSHLYGWIVKYKRLKEFNSNQKQ
ncbi:MAG: ferric reductase-like transmembrane domain-containing protein [Nanoarchaeota archaeon]